MNENNVINDDISIFIQVELVNIEKNRRLCLDDLKEFKITGDNKIFLEFTDGFRAIHTFNEIEYKFKGNVYYPHTIVIYSEEI